MKVLCAFSATAGLVFAGSALAEPVALSDAELADVAAGYYAPSPSGRDGIIVGDAAEADIHAASAVTLDAAVQAHARAVTLVNGAHSDVANGSNVWDGSAASAFVLQENRIQQQAPTAAYLGDWQLQGENRDIRKTETFDSEFSGGILAHEFTFTGDVTTTTTRTDSKNKSDTSSNTTHPTESLKIGLGVAMAGEVNVASGAGGIVFTDSMTGDTTTTSTSSFNWSGIFFDFTTEESVTITSHVEGGVSGGVSLGPFALQTKGVFCQTLVGSCKPYTGRYRSDSHTEETVLFPARLQGASAGRIVMSDGALQQEVESSVVLEDQAQRDLRTLHAVNAAGSQVANGANVARGMGTTTLPRAMGLQQHNQINQRQ